MRQLKQLPVQNTRRYHGDLLPQTKKALDEFNAPFNRRLTYILGDEKWLWANQTVSWGAMKTALFIFKYIEFSRCVILVH